MYIPIYCSKVSISRRLRGRLNIQIDEYTSSPYEQSVPSQSVEDSLVDQVIQQTEEFIDLILNQIYELPLNNKHTIITNICESLVISELLRIHFQGQGIAQLAGDLSGAGSDTKQYAYGLLQMITAGHNIHIPGMPPIQAISGMTQPQPIKLIGEVPKQIYDDTITRQFTYIDKNSNVVNLKPIDDIVF
jgi:hypothetical protein